MNIILMSGGSGKRLWPISNDVQSKQFIKLLKNEQGKSESMLQRVYRQLIDAGLTDNITIATNRAQAEMIRSQLDEVSDRININIVIEPERRDTYPAVLLTSAYLFYEKRVKEDEIVAVLPVDSYVDLSYFQTLIKMENAMKQECDNLQTKIMLMGIEPKCPESGFGYIVPEMNQNIAQAAHRNNQYPESTSLFQIQDRSHEDCTDIYKVKYFVEKPKSEYATELIKNGALWNGGIFVFRLGYIVEHIKNKYKIASYDEILNRYSEIENTSFDYAFVEKENNIKVIKYSGVWNDIGNWNALTNVLDSRVVGKAKQVGKSENTYIINELEIPLLSVNVENIVIAASPDGILVADKSLPFNLKEYTSTFVNRPMYETRRWGEYRVLNYVSYQDGTETLTKHLKIHAGKGISYQLHRKRKEIWTIINGVGHLVLNDEISEVHGGDVVIVYAGMKHMIQAVTDLDIIEVQMGSELSEDDIERI